MAGELDSRPGGESAVARPLSVRSVLPALLCLFVLVEVNYPTLSPQSQLAIFGSLGLVYCFMTSRSAFLRPWLDRLCILLSALCGGYIVVQTEGWFSSLWLQGTSLGNRAGQEPGPDLLIGLVGLLLVLEAARRSLGWALPALSSIFLAYCFLGPHLPGWLLPHRGYSLDRVVSHVFLQSQGVFGIALRVMFSYVFLFVVFGVLLELTGVIAFILDLARRVFSRSSGAPGKIAVVASGLMGSLSGSAVANTATTGTFTIPLMKNSGFQPSVAGGVVAAASSGGALMPPVMGAAAYMMLEMVTPPVTYLQIIRSALLPALLYYFSLLLLVHLYSRRYQLAEQAPQPHSVRPAPWAGVIFSTSLGLLLIFLFLGYTPFRAVTAAILGAGILSLFSRRTRLTPSKLMEACQKSARGGVPLICAAACVGIIIGVVTLTGLGTRLPSLILPLAQENLFAALFLIMICSLILGMGLPSAVCYLLLATFIGSVLGDLGIVPLAGHFFIFYFGMMSMVTPPVALAAYAAATIAGSGIMVTAWRAFSFALVGFTLPYMFVLQPELLLLDSSGDPVSLVVAIPALSTAVLGITALAGSLAGFFFSPLNSIVRGILFLSAALLLYPADFLRSFAALLPTLAGLILLVLCVSWSWYRRHPSPGGSG